MCDLGSTALPGMHVGTARHCRSLIRPEDKPGFVARGIRKSMRMAALSALFQPVVSRHSVASHERGLVRINA